MYDLPELHEGHAPITLLEVFREALDAYEDWDYGLPEPHVFFEGKPVAISAVFDHMRACTDILPGNLVGIITARLTKPWNSDSPLDEMTIATAARVMAILVRKRQLHEREESVASFLSRMDTRRGSRPHA